MIIEKIEEHRNPFNDNTGQEIVSLLTGTILDSENAIYEV